MGPRGSTGKPSLCEMRQERCCRWQLTGQSRMDWYRALIFPQELSTLQVAAANGLKHPQRLDSYAE